MKTNLAGGEILSEKTQIDMRMLGNIFQMMFAI